MTTKAPQVPAALDFEALLETVEALGNLKAACLALKLDRRNLHRYLHTDPMRAQRLSEAYERGAPARKLWLQAKLEEHIEEMNVTALIFALKREDSSYRDSYSVTTSSTPTDYVIDLSSPAEHSTQLSDVTPEKLLGE